MIRAHFSGVWLWLLLAAVLGMRAFVPQGYMVTAGQDQIAISICTGQGPATVLVDKAQGSDHSQGDKQDAAQRCAFADLTVPGLAAVPPFELALALAFVLALWLAPVAPLRLAGIGRLRPPLRGPPSRI